MFLVIIYRRIGSRNHIATTDTNSVITIIATIKLRTNDIVSIPTEISTAESVLCLFAQMLCVYNVAVCYICFDNFLCLVNLHVAYQFRILEYRLTNLHSIVQKQPDDQNLDNDLSSCTILCYAKLRNCVQQHQMLTEYCTKIENVFTMIILCQVLFFGLVLCLLAYQLFLVSTRTSNHTIITLLN